MYEECGLSTVVQYTQYIHYNEKKMEKQKDGTYYYRLRDKQQLIFPFITIV